MVWPRIPYHVLTHWGGGGGGGGQNGRHFADDIFKCVFLNEDIWISMNISPKFVPQYSSIGSDNGLVPIRWQAIIWINDRKFTDAYMRHSTAVS